MDELEEDDAVHAFDGNMDVYDEGVDFYLLAALWEACGGR